MTDPDLPQGEQGIRGEQGVRGIRGKRGQSVMANDVPDWILQMLRALVPAYLILGLAVGAAFFVAYQWAEKENERICAVMVETTRGNAEAIIAASNANPPEIPRTPKQEARRDTAIADYRARIEAVLEPCNPSPL